MALGATVLLGSILLTFVGGTLGCGREQLTFTQGPRRSLFGLDFYEVFVETPHPRYFLPYHGTSLYFTTIICSTHQTSKSKIVFSWRAKRARWFGILNEWYLF